MALKMDRQVDATEIGYFLNEVAERGAIVSVSTEGSGVALDSPKNLATVAASPSGNTPLGVLLNDFVSVDLTRTPINWFKDQSSVGDKCSILTKGWVVTDFVLGTVSATTPVAVLAESGNVRAVALGVAPSSAVPHVGRFRSLKSEDGFIRLYVDL